MVGTTLGHYEILEPLGKGGMGEVYRARDTKLDRDVAIKVLSEEFATDPERLARFEREAKSVAALDHPNIVTVYSVEEVDGLHFITMQLVEGTTLSEAIPRSGLTVEKYFATAVSLADALAAAHGRGITHRDLKPSNVMVAPDGAVKVLDFGLAKLADNAGDGADGVSADVGTAFDTADPDEPLTEEGKILGTVAYMSPEQAEGKVVDHRSDIFSLGIILYEMAAGERPFTGDSKLSVMSSIVKDTPTSITELNAQLPRHLGRIVKHALEKDVGRRFQSALDLKNELEELAAEVKSGEALPVSALGTSGTRRFGIAHAVAAAAIIGSAVLIYAVWDPASGPTEEEAAWRSVRLTNLPGMEQGGNISPDGDEFVYSGDASGNLDIYLQKVDGANPINLTPDSPARDIQPAFSPDGRIAFYSAREPAGIYIMGPTGENQRFLAPDGFEPKWSPDGSEITYSSFGVGNPRSVGADPTISIVDVASGQTRALTIGYQPAWSPNGRRIAFFEIEDGSVRDLWTVDVDTGERVAVTADSAVDWSPAWSPDGRYLYFASDRGGAENIWRIRIDEETGGTLGRPEAVTAGGSERQGHLSISGDGNRLVYTSTSIRTNLLKIGFDPDAETVVGSPESITRGSRSIASFDVSPDGSHAVFSETLPQEDLFTIGTDGTAEYRMTNDPFRERRPRWAPVGNRIAVYAAREGSYNLWTFDPDGRSPMRHTAVAGVWDATWSPDGRQLLVYIPTLEGNPPTGNYLVDASLPHDEQTLTALAGSEEPAPQGRATDWSSDGRVLGFRSPQGGVWMYTFETEGYEQVTSTGGYPRWLADNNRLLYANAGAIWLANVATGEVKEIFNMSPDVVVEPKTLASEGNRTIYFRRREQDADVYLLTREQ